MSLSWASALRITILLLLLAAVIVACFTLPIEKMMKDFLLWVDHDLGPWGPLVLAVAYIPLTVLAVPASVLTLGGGYLFGLPVGFVADSIGATVGAGAAFLLGRTIGRSFVVSRLKDYPQFRSVAIAIRRSGFKIVLLLRLVPLLPFNMLNYLLSVTPVSIGEYMLASWLGMMPITLALVYVGTTLKDLSDVTHGWGEFSKTRWVRNAILYYLYNEPFKRYNIHFFLLWMQAFIILGLVISVVLMICVTKVAKAALDKALAENEDIDGITSSPDLPIVAEPSADLNQPLIIKIDSSEDSHEK
ncbi:TVP38/TMEM64 family membrane protein slr0305 [Glycine soja]